MRAGDLEVPAHPLEGPLARRDAQLLRAVVVHDEPLTDVGGQSVDAAGSVGIVTPQRFAVLSLLNGQDDHLCRAGRK